MNNKQMKNTFKNQYSSFAKNNIAHQNNLHLSTDFPDNLWEKMIKEGLFGICIPKKFNGQGKNLQALSIAGKTLVENGHNLGFVFSWIIHELVSFFCIYEFGNNEQHAELLPQLANGKATACLAVSEKKVGAHPKHIKTSGTCKNGYYILNGEKTYLTNGPIADWFIVIATTNTFEGRKQFTAFIVSKKNPGLLFAEPLGFPFLRPCQHGGIILKNCKVPISAVLGKIEFAYEQIALPFRKVETAVLSGVISGAVASQMALIIKEMKQQNIPIDKKLKSTIGRLQSITFSIATLSYEVIRQVTDNPESLNTDSLLICLYKMLDEFQTTFNHIYSLINSPQNGRIYHTMKDLNILLSMADKIGEKRLQQIGEMLLCS